MEVPQYIRRKMSNIFYANKELLQTYNKYNRDKFNHGYSDKEFEDLDEDVMYPVSKAVSYTHLTLPTNREV